MNHQLADTADELIGYEIELISDGDGLAVLGPTAAVELFLTAHDLKAQDMRLQKLGSKIGGGAGAVQVGSQIAENSGRWVKLTEKSARALQDFTPMKGSDPRFARAIVTEKGKINGILEFVRTPTALLTSPAVLAGAAGIMAQFAMQQTMDEITDYLAKIDAKVDDVLRAQKDAALADMIGVELVIEEAMIIRERVSFVSDVTWSKVQSTTVDIARTQAYAVRQLDALADKLERTTKMGDLADLADDAQRTVQEWLAVLARCFQLQDAIAVLEIDRVLDDSPNDPGEVERHRQALQTARQRRRQLIAQTTAQLIKRMDAAAERANKKVLLAPNATREVVLASNHVATDIVDFHARLGIEHDRDSLEARRWRDAAADVRDGVLDAGADGIGAVGRFGSEAATNTRVAAGKLAGALSERLLRERDGKTREDIVDDQTDSSQEPADPEPAN